MHPNHRTASNQASQVALALGAILAAIAVPVVWLLIAARIQGASGVTHMTKQTALAIFPGVVITYFLLLALVGRIEARQRERSGEPTGPSWPIQRASWNRSMRDEPFRPGGHSLTAIERAFVIVATLATIGFDVWFFFFAGSPI